MVLAHCITRAPRKDGEAPVPPVRPDGTTFDWAITASGLRAGTSDPQRAATRPAPHAFDCGALFDGRDAWSCPIPPTDVTG